MTELQDKRTYNRKEFLLDDGSKALEIHTGHIHYVDTSGEFQDVDIVPETRTSEWKVNKANYNLTVKKVFTSPNLIRFDNLFDGANHTMYFEPHSLVWMNKDLNDVVEIATAQAVTGTRSGRVITFTEAFGPGFHFEVTSRLHGFTKEIVIDSLESVGEQPSPEHRLVFLTKLSIDKLLVDKRDGGTWDKNAYLEGEKGFSFSEAKEGAKTIIKDAFIRDSDNNQQQIKLFMRKKAGSLYQGKILDLDFMKSATYPVRCDAVADYYSGSGDGSVRCINASWATARGATNGTLVDNSGYILSYRTGASGTDYGIYKTFLPFDTSGLPDSITVSGVDLRVKMNGEKYDQDNDANAYITVVQGTPASNTALVTEDFDQAGTTEGIDTGEREDITGTTTTSTLTFSLNSTGRGWVNATGYTVLALREGHDLQNDQPNLGSFGLSGIGIVMSEDGDTTTDPKLTITYTENTSTFIPKNCSVI